MELDIHLDGQWRACAAVELPEGASGMREGRLRLRYEVDYAAEHLEARDFRALTVRAPVDLGVRTLPHWPSFLIDLLPQGAARRRIERNAAAGLSEWELLQRGALNPVGNLRVRPREERVQQAHPGFTLDEMVARGDAFVDYAQELGATVAGATDTQGEAPKFWVVEDMKGRWHPDSGVLGFPVQRYALLKFPMPEAGPRAEQILRHEAAYLRVAQRLGLRVTPALPQFVGGALLIPRFDRRTVEGREVRLGVESLYSVAGVLDSTATPFRHHDALIALAGCLTDFDTEIVEYTRRDLLNIALGNRDNHGRNTAVLKETDRTLRLAPLYDFGPAFLDGRNIARAMRWDGENPAGLNWNRVLENLATRFEEARVATQAWLDLIQAMHTFAHDLEELPGVLRECGIDAEVIESRTRNIEQLQDELRAVEVPG